MSPHERLREFIRQARDASANPDSAPSVAHVLLTSMWAELSNDFEVMQVIAAAGLNSTIRAWLTRRFSVPESEAAELRERQAELWPREVQAIVKQIDRERVYVPSRDEHVELVPDALTASELHEAGEYLIGHGEDCIRRGQLLLRLARLHGPASERAA